MAYAEPVGIYRVSRVPTDSYFAERYLTSGMWHLRKVRARISLGSECKLRPPQLQLRMLAGLLLDSNVGCSLQSQLRMLSPMLQGTEPLGSGWDLVCTAQLIVFSFAQSAGVC